MNIGEQLRTIRKGACLTQEDVAEKLCITRQALSNWEQGKTIPDLYTFVQLAAVYNFSPDEFLLGKKYFKGSSNMKTNYSDAQIEGFIGKWYPAIIDLTPLSGGLVSQTFSFISGGEKYIFQIGNKKESYEKEMYISNHYRDALPVREMLEIHETDDGIAYCISHYIKGHKLDKLSERERREIVMPMIKLMKRMDQIKIPSDKGYGRFDASGYARYKTWLDFISVVYNDRVYDWSGLAAKGYDDLAVRKAIEKIREHIECVQLEKACFVLCDFDIIADNGCITGVIDSDYALYGDPLYNVASILFWDHLKLRDLTVAVMRHYLADEDSKRKTYCYILRYALEEIYNTVVLNEIGYDGRWIRSRLDELLESGLCHTKLTP